MSVNLTVTPPSRHCLACIARALCPHFISLVSGDRRMNPLIHLVIPAIRLHKRMRLLLSTGQEKYNHRSVCLLAYCNSVPRAYLQSLCLSWWRAIHGKGKHVMRNVMIISTSHSPFLFSITVKHIKPGSTGVDCVGFSTC